HVEDEHHVGHARWLVRRSEEPHIGEGGEGARGAVFRRRRPGPRAIERLRQHTPLLLGEDDIPDHESRNVGLLDIIRRLRWANRDHAKTVLAAMPAVKPKPSHRCDVFEWAPLYTQRAVNEVPTPDRISAYLKRLLPRGRAAGQDQPSIITLRRFA